MQDEAVDTPVSRLTNNQSHLLHQLVNQMYVHLCTCVVRILLLDAFTNEEMDFLSDGLHLLLIVCCTCLSLVSAVHGKICEGI